MEKRVLKFSSFDEQKAREVLGIKEERKENLIEAWEKRAASMSISDEEMKTLKRLYNKLNLYVRSWHEEDLKLKFIGPLIELVNFDDYEKEITAFSERSLSITIQEVEFKGSVDLMVATGIYDPKQPFFFIHEYKREENSSGNPVGQLLVTMFAAKELNKKPRNFTLFETPQQDYSSLPIYGVYVIGRIWVFVGLNDNRYFLSKSYDSTDFNKLEHILKMLKAQKEMILDTTLSVIK